LIGLPDDGLMMHEPLVKLDTNINGAINEAFKKGIKNL